MSTIFKYSVMLFAVVAFGILPVNRAAAQDKADQSGRKVLVKVTTIDNGDTTFTEKELGSDDSEFEWVDEKSGDLVFISEDENEDDGGEKEGVIYFSDEGGDVTIIEAGAGDDEGDVVVTMQGLSKEQVEKLKSGKDGRPTKIIVRKMRPGHGGHGEHGRMDCRRESSSCCAMEKDGMHMKMKMKDMDRMHNKMMWKEKKDGDDDEDEEKEDENEKEDDNLF